MLRKAITAAALTAALSLAIAPANAHPRLRNATPASGATLQVAPSEIRMKFSEGVIAQFTAVELKDAKGRSVPTGAATLSPGDNTKVVVPIKARLAAGTYAVAWHAVSVDTHRVSGSYTFKVAR
jgi:hypothetical protein